MSWSSSSHGEINLASRRVKDFGGRARATRSPFATSSPSSTSTASTRIAVITMGICCQRANTNGLAEFASVHLDVQRFKLL